MEPNLTGNGSVFIDLKKCQCFWHTHTSAAYQQEVQTEFPLVFFTLAQSIRDFVCMRLAPFSLSFLNVIFTTIDHKCHLPWHWNRRPFTLKDVGFWEVFFWRNEVCLIKFSSKWRSKYFIWKLRCSANFWHLDQCF